MYIQYSFAHVFLINRNQPRGNVSDQDRTCTEVESTRGRGQAEFERTLRRGFLYTQNVLAHNHIFARVGRKGAYQYSSPCEY
jgi:hypothetical protein